VEGVMSALSSIRNEDFSADSLNGTKYPV